MAFHVVSKHLSDGVFVLKPDVFGDDRGFFMESYNKVHFKDIGLNLDFVQDNHSSSVKHVVRGLHFQWDPPQGKLMRITVGTAFVVAVDIRKNSPTLGQWFGCEASAENKLQVWASAGFARGFMSLTDRVEVQYKCTGTYNNKCESGILWNDPDVGIEWPENPNPILSEKDAKAQTLKQWLDNPLSDNFKF